MNPFLPAPSQAGGTYARHADLLVLHRSYPPRFALLARVRGELRAGLLLAGFAAETIECCVLVVDELFANAVGASRPGGEEIDVIAYRAADGDLLVEVYDSSPPVPPRRRQGHGGRAGGGTGLTGKGKGRAWRRGPSVLRDTPQENSSMMSSGRWPVTM